MASANWYLDKFTSSGTVKEFCGRSFCPDCGTRVFHLNDRRVEVLFGALDDGPTDLKPTVEGWIIRREHWAVAVEGAAQFDRNVS